MLTPEYKHAAPRSEAAAGAALCQAVAISKKWTKRLETLEQKPGRKRKIAGLEHVSAAAQPFAAGVALASLKNPRRVWVLTRDLRAQETMSHDLSAWWGATQFFPEREEMQIADAVPDAESQAERLAILRSVATPPAKVEVLVLNVSSLEEMVPHPQALARSAITVHPGDSLEMDRLAAQLEEAGYERMPQAAERGQFAVRGGIFDVYPWQSELPLRIELFDREVESIRQYDPDTQVSVGRVTEGSILLQSGEADVELVPLSECIRAEDLVLAVELDECPRADVWITTGTVPDGDEGVENFDTACPDEPVGSFDAGDFVLQEKRRGEFVDQLCRWHADGWRVCMFFNNEGEIERFNELIRHEALDEEFLETRLGQVTRGFSVPAAKLAVLSDAEIFGRYQHSRARRLITEQRRSRARRAPLDLSDIKEGDFVVHQEFGIGKYGGLIRRAESGGAEEDVVVIDYADQARLYVPLAQAWLISKYVGLGKRIPELSKLGDGKWKKTKAQTERSIFQYAERLIQMQANRQTASGFEHPPDNKWQMEFEQSFLYKETVDQLKAIEETKHDMETPRPMDRLICGDVGFGKTEVAIRAAFKAVMSGKQVAILAPTTVLSQQHYHNFRERMSDYPVRVDVLNRFRTAAESRKVLASLAAGEIDIIVGTHRLISKDVVFKDLGLAVVDEEQRFGVVHKEKFKELFLSVDVLTLSATPIPRTLYMALMGVRDMSTIDTPPANRTPVETVICGYDERVIKKAIERELKRKGQVFFLHNRVGSIERMVDKIQGLSPPGTRIEAGHGQMEEGMLEEVMQRFVSGQTDILVCTTIIESGIDIPNANTIIIDRADRFGLADLYQLRGRVGRAGHKAYAYLMIPRSEMTTGDARKRINAMKQYTALGSGFKIAMRDLEIRGAGNLLGTQQSGHIVAVGFDLYCQMLKASVNKLQGKRTPGRVELLITVDFIAFSEAEMLKSAGRKIPAFIPESYITEASQRIPAYRQLAELTAIKELHELIKVWRDRFGRPPEEVDTLLRCTELKLQAHRAGCSSLEIKDNKLMLIRNGDFILPGGKFPRLNEKSPPRERLMEAINLVRQL
ncbi:MAG TPA: transcription-repair coupling factor [Verrucomicrobiales bacterium]|nr:transcription-repair coupling factor [Verrucomicrobiales bacterium]